jgi:CRP-like cAMP-binding protein
VEVLRQPQGREEVIARLGKDQCFGEMALLTKTPRNATVRAVTQVCVAVLGKDHFQTLLSVLPATKEDILKTVQARVMAAATERP